MLTQLHNHPLVRHYLTILRDQTTTAVEFRRVCDAMTRAIMMEAARGLVVETFTVQTPLESTEGARIEGQVVLVPILRAGLGMLEASLEIIPNATVGYIGLERDETTAVARCYYSKMPDLNEVKHVFLLDPMLATGGSAVQSLERLKSLGAHRITMVCILSAPEGVATVEAAHPDVDIVTGVVDRQLDENKYIRPGLGDFGDRLFGT
jgi:uracil phosphoribosyltransferase